MIQRKSLDAAAREAVHMRGLRQAQDADAPQWVEKAVEVGEPVLPDLFALLDAEQAVDRARAEAALVELGSRWGGEDAPGPDGTTARLGGAYGGNGVPHALVVEGAHHVDLSGFRFEFANEEAVLVKDSSDITLMRGAVSSTRAAAVRVTGDSARVTVGRFRFSYVNGPLVQLDPPGQRLGPLQDEPARRLALDDGHRHALVAGLVGHGEHPLRPGSALARVGPDPVDGPLVVGERRPDVLDRVRPGAAEDQAPSAVGLGGDDAAAVVGAVGHAGSPLPRARRPRAISVSRASSRCAHRSR